MAQRPYRWFQALRCVGALALLPGAWLTSAPGADLSVNAHFPGGNILVEKIDGNTVWLRQELRDTARFWFYWLFEVRGAGSRTVEFRFTNGEVFGSRGPALSRDGGRTWAWLGTNTCRGASFQYSFGREEREVRFGFTIPYTERELNAFLSRFAEDPALRIGTLGRTPKGRAIEWLRVGRVDGQARHRVLITCRHHACETMASFAVEGLLEQVLGSDSESAWFRENTEVCVAPFLDKDGVEDGDQGKLRQPHDHWLDYGGVSRYTAVRALRARFNATNGPAVPIALDLHCPYIRDEKIYLAASPDPRIADQTARFSQLLEQQREGPLVYRRADNLLSGQGWNRPQEYGSNLSFMHWAESLPGSEVVATVELPYATVGSVEVTPESARAFGKDLASALRVYLEARGKTPPNPRSALAPDGRMRPASASSNQASNPAWPLADLTNAWSQMVSRGTLTGAPWPRHTIDAASRGADGVKLADVDRDGRPDIITGWEEGGDVRIYLHPGATRCRELWPRLTIGRVRSPEDAVFADLDGDGRLDGVSATEGTEQTIFVHWSPPEPNWRVDASWATHPLPVTRGQQMWMFLVPMQVDGQHGLDLLTGSKGDSGAIGWLQAPPRARDLDAWRWHPLRKAGWIMSLRPLDLDADGDADILFSDRKGPAAGVGWLENPGPAAAQNQAGWQEHPLGARGREVMFLDVGDLDGDGSPEIVVAVKPSEILLLHRQATNWVEEWIHVDAQCGRAKAVKMADLNQDGRMDLVLSCEGATGPLRGVIWLRREARGWRARDLSGPDGVKFDLVETLDIDGDGDQDVLTCEEAENLGVFWYENPAR